MMDEKQSRMLALVVLVLFVLFIAYRRARYMASSNPGTQAAAGDATLYPDDSGVSGGTPGMLSNPEYMNNASAPIAGPSGNINITVNPWNAINQTYMPLFGFVGVSSGAYQ